MNMELQGHLFPCNQSPKKQQMPVWFQNRKLNLAIIITQRVLGRLAKWVLRWSDNNGLWRLRTLGKGQHCKHCAH